MAREQYIKTKKDCIYYYKDTKNKRKYAYRYKFQDPNSGRRIEKTKRGFNSIEECERALVEVKAQVLSNNYEIVKNELMTVEMLLSKFINAKKDSWKITTYKSSDIAIRCHIVPRIGAMKLKQVTNGILQTKIVDPMIAAGYKATTIESVYRTLNSAFNYAIGGPRS